MGLPDAGSCLSPKKSSSDYNASSAPKNVLTAPEDLIPYSFDGTAGMQQMPGCVLFAKTTEHVAGVLSRPAKPGQPL